MAGFYVDNRSKKLVMVAEKNVKLCWIPVQRTESRPRAAVYLDEMILSQPVSSFYIRVNDASHYRKATEEEVQTAVRNLRTSSNLLNMRVGMLEHLVKKYYS